MERVDGRVPKMLSPSSQRACLSPGQLPPAPQRCTIDCGRNGDDDSIPRRGPSAKLRQPIAEHPQLTYLCSFPPLDMRGTDTIAHSEQEVRG